MSFFGNAIFHIFWWSCCGVAFSSLLLVVLFLSLLLLFSDLYVSLVGGGVSPFKRQRNGANELNQVQ